MNSKAFSINTKDILALSKNAAFVALAAGLSYFGQNLANVDLGSASALIVPIVAVVIDSIIKWAKDNTETKE